MSSELEARDRLVRVEEQCSQTHEMLKDLHSHIVGNPGNDGLVTRVAKVEQRQSVLTRIAATVCTAVIGLMVWLFKGRV